MCPLELKICESTIGMDSCLCNNSIVNILQWSPRQLKQSHPDFPLNSSHSKSWIFAPLPQCTCLSGWFLPPLEHIHSSWRELFNSQRTVTGCEGHISESTTVRETGKRKKNGMYLLLSTYIVVGSLQALHEKTLAKTKVLILKICIAVFKMQSKYDTHIEWVSIGSSSVVILGALDQWLTFNCCSRQTWCCMWLLYMLVLCSTRWQCWGMLNRTLSRTIHSTLSAARVRFEVVRIHWPSTDVKRTHATHRLSRDLLKLNGFIGDTSRQISRTCRSAATLLSLSHASYCYFL